MRWILGSVATLIVVAVVAALVAPRLIEWNDYRPRIAEALAQRTGLQAEIDGELHLVLLPAPTLFAGDVRLTQPARPGRPLAQVEGLRAELDPLALLLGEVVPRGIALDAPEISLQLRQDGPSEAIALTRQLLAPGVAGAGRPLRNLSIRSGRLTLLRGDDQQAVLAGIDLDFAAPDAGQPGHMQLDARWNDLPVSLSLDIGALPPSGATTLRLRAELAGGLAQAGYGGTLDLGAGDGGAAAGVAAMEGMVTATVRDPAALLSLFGLPEAEAQNLPREQMALTARLIAEPGSLVVNDLDLRWGRATAGGAAAAILGPPLDLNLTLQVAGLEMDALAGMLPRLLPDPADGLRLPEIGRITFDVTATALRLHGSVVRRVQLAGVLNRGSLDLQDLRADLPGSASVSLQGQLVTPSGMPEFTGRMLLEAADARRTLLWLGMAEDRLPPAAPRRLRAEAGLQLDAGLWRLIDMAAEVDGASLHGGVAVRPSGRPSFSANLRLAGMHLDPWVPVFAQALAEGAAAPAGRGNDGATLPAGAWLTQLGRFLSGVDSNLRLGLRNLSWQQRILEEASIDLALVRGQLALNRAALAFADGMRMELSGNAATGAEGGRLDYDLNVSAEGRQLLSQIHRLLPVVLPDGGGAAGPPPDAGTLAGLAARPPAAPPGGSRLTLRITGDPGQALLRDVVLDMPGGHVAGRGTLGLAAPVPTLVADLDWQVQDPHHLREHLADEIVLPFPGLYRYPSQGSAALTVDAGTVAVSRLTLSMPGLAVTGQGRIGRTAIPATFELSLGAQAASLPALFQPLARAGAAAAMPAGPDLPLEVPVTLVLHAAGTEAAVTLQEARLAYGMTELRLTGTGRLAPNLAMAGNLSLAAPDLSGLLTRAGVPPAGSGRPLGPIDITGAYMLDRQGVRVEDLAGMAGPVRLGAALALDWQGERPLLQADIGLAGLPLDRLLPAELAPLEAIFLAGGPGVMPERPPGLLRGLEIDLALAAEGLTAGAGLFAEGRVEAQLRDHELTVAVLEGAFGGGRIAGSGKLDARGLPALSLTAELQDIDAATVLSAIGGLGGLTGRADGTLRLRTAGRSPAEMLDRLSGQAGIDLREGRFEGLGLDALRAEALREPPHATEPEDLREILLAAGEASSFATLSGLLFLESGVLRLQQVTAEMPDAGVAWHGSVNLPARELDLTGTFRLTGLPEAPAVEVEIDGPFGALQRHALVDPLAQYLSGRATAARLLAPAEAPEDGSAPTSPMELAPLAQ